LNPSREGVLSITTAGRTYLGFLFAVLTLVATARGQESPFADTSGSAPPPPRWGFTGNLGVGSINGDFSHLLRQPISGEFSLFRAVGPWRFGLGLNINSFEMKEPYSSQPEWAAYQPFLSATRVLVTQGKIHPYLQVRVGVEHLHPRSLLFLENPLPPDYKFGVTSPTRHTNGPSFGVVPGIEWDLNRSLAVDLSGSFTYFNVSQFDLSVVGLPPASSGSTFEARLGVRWHPDDGYPAGVPSAGQPERERDAWGVTPNYGWAFGEVLGINFVSMGINEFVRNEEFTQANPRSWWYNLTNSFEYDSDQFKTNQLGHPYNGSAYFNAARSNGLNFWVSSAYALFGDFVWECCGETYPISTNDLFATGVGGITLGETFYRMSSEILDNQATGSGRFFKELAAFLVDPVRGLNRQLSGRAHEQDSNPEDPLDWRPPHGSSLITVGARLVGQGGSLSNSSAYGNFEFDHRYGSVYDNDRRKPYDYFDFALQLTTGQTDTLTTLRIRGDLWEKPLGSDQTAPNHVFAVSQFYDFLNNPAFSFGGQSVAATLYSRFRLSDSLGINTRVDGIGLMMGAINTGYTHLADLPENPRLRLYDYGPGLGASAEANLVASGRSWLTLYYRFQWLSIASGSIFSKGDLAVGFDANHYIQAGGGRVVVPIFGNVALGADGYIFVRDSHYASPLHEYHAQSPEARVYVAWSSGH
jgi:hypothetical protein